MLQEADLHEPLDRWWQETGQNELRQILFWKWDPIGVGYAFPNTGDEYDIYAPAVVSALAGRVSDRQLAELLLEFERATMGMSNRDLTDKLCGLAVDLSVWFEASLISWANR